METTRRLVLLCDRTSPIKDKRASERQSIPIGPWRAILLAMFQTPGRGGVQRKFQTVYACASINGVASGYVRQVVHGREDLERGAFRSAAHQLQFLLSSDEPFCF
jgi:hypothetical protein